MLIGCVFNMAPVIKALAIDKYLGGMAHSPYLMERIVPRVRFLAQVDVLPGENELEALAYGIQRVLRQEEKPHTFVEGAPYCTND